MMIWDDHEPHDPARCSPAEFGLLVTVQMPVLASHETVVGQIMQYGANRRQLISCMPSTERPAFPPPYGI